MFLEDCNCAVCSLCTEETLLHLFLNCPFAEQCWNILGINITPGSTFPEVVTEFKIRLQSKFFMVATILMSWAIWAARNDLIFKGLQPSIERCKAILFKELRLVLFRVKPSLLPSFELWSHNLIPLQ